MGPVWCTMWRALAQALPLTVESAEGEAQQGSDQWAMYSPPHALLGSVRMSWLTQAVTCTSTESMQWAHVSQKSPINLDQVLWSNDITCWSASTTEARRECGKSSAAYMGSRARPAAMPTLDAISHMRWSQPKVSVHSSRLVPPVSQAGPAMSDQRSC